MIYNLLMKLDRNSHERNKKLTGKDKFDWNTFDLDKFFRDTERAGEIIRERDSLDNAERV